MNYRIPSTYYQKKNKEVSSSNLYEDLGAARAYALVCLFQDAYMHQCNGSRGGTC